MIKIGEESWLLSSMAKSREVLLSFLNPYQYPLRWGALILLIGSIWIAVQFSINWLMGPVCLSPANSQIVTVNINKGSTLVDIGETLADNKVIKSSRFFVHYGRLTGQDKKMQAGTYQISNNWSMKEIVECISSGKVAGYRLAIPEGYTVKQIEDLLVQKGIADRELFQKALGANYPLSFLEGISETGYERLEGFLFPATYELRPGMSEEEIIKLMLEKFQTVFTPQLQQRADEVDLSVREIITLASIVEREAKLEEERPQVAAVFLNRLQRGMRLESCATVQYILGKQKETLTTKDLQNPSPYNTYLHTGLPPGPIANPGASSIKAVLYPADVDYLFFVARGDGSHQFSKTFREHQEAARKYQKR
jgi:UPF0755 protein